MDESGAAELDLVDRPEVQEKLRRRIESVKVKASGGGVEGQGSARRRA